MRMRLRLAGTLLAAVLSVGTSQAQQTHVADVSNGQQAIARQVQADRSNRETIVRVLQQKDVRDHARLMGLNLEGVERGLATLNSAELATLAASAQNIERDLTGGSDVLAHSLTLLLLLVLIVVVVD